MKLHTLQTSFIAGQLDDAAQARSETSLYRNGARSLRNCWPLATGGVTTRPGTRLRATLPGPAVLAEFLFSRDQAYVVAFSAGRADFFHATDGSPAGSVTGQPWGADILRELRFEQLGDVMWVCHQSFHPIELVRTGVASFVARLLPWDGWLGMPTFRYAPAGIAAQVTGSLTTQISLAAAPTVAGVPLAMTPGLAGQARIGAGAWHAFTVTSAESIAGTTVIQVAWIDAPLAAAVGLSLQFASSTAPGLGGGVAGPASDGSGGSSGADAGSAGPGSSGSDSGGDGSGGPGGPGGGGASG